MKSIRKQTPINMWNSINSGLTIGILAFVGHTLMYDMLYMDDAYNLIKNTTESEFITLNVLLAMFITITIAIGKMFGLMFSTELCI
jgi:hypothetical protein